jgi:hypothetical protein
MVVKKLNKSEGKDLKDKDLKDIRISQSNMRMPFVYRPFVYRCPTRISKDFSMRTSSLLFLICFVILRVFSEEPSPPAIDISPVIGHLSMLKRVDNVSLNYQSSTWKKTPEEDWKVSTISTLAISGNRFRVDEKIDKKNTVIAKNSDDTWFKIYKNIPEFSISCDSETFRFIDRSNGELIFFQLQSKPKSEHHATFSEITKGYRNSYPWDAPFRYMPMDKVPNSGEARGLWERRSDKAIETAIAALRKSIVERKVDSGGIWYRYLQYLSEESEGSTYWVYFIKHKDMNGQYIPVRFERRDEGSNNVIDWLKIEYIVHNNIAVPLLITDMDQNNHSRDEGFETRLSDRQFDIDNFNFAIDPSEAKQVVDYVTGLEIEP